MSLAVLHQHLPGFSISLLNGPQGKIIWVCNFSRNALFKIILNDFTQSISASLGHKCLYGGQGGPTSSAWERVYTERGFLPSSWGGSCRCSLSVSIKACISPFTLYNGLCLGSVLPTQKSRHKNLIKVHTPSSHRFLK